MFALLVVRAAALFGMFGKGTALNALKARRSVVKYSDKAVPASATMKALEAAIQAPNHFLSEPWRFYTAGQMQCTNHIAPPRLTGCFTHRSGDEGQALWPQRGEAQGRGGRARVADRDVRVRSGV